MDALSAGVDALVDDARRAARPGAIGDAPDRPGQVVGRAVPDILAPTTPSGSPLSVAIDGAGFFIVDDGGQRAFTRLGDFRVDAHGKLVDGARRTLLGCAAGNLAFAALAPIDASGYADVTIDERGWVLGTKVNTQVRLARIPLAVFVAPERLARADDFTLRSSPAAGTAQLAFPLQSNIGAFKLGQLDASMVDLGGDLARLWRTRREGEIAAAETSAADSCERGAMGLVK